MSDSKINERLPLNRGLPLENKSEKISLNQNKKIDDREFVPKKYKEVAANMEQQFAEMMIDQMNRTIDVNESESNSAGMDYYKSLEKSERAKSLAQQNNLGLQDMILNQIYPKRLRTEIALKQYEAQMGQIHHNLPSYKIDEKTDTIKMRKNDSSSVSDERALDGTKNDGGLL